MLLNLFFFVSVSFGIEIIDSGSTTPIIHVVLTSDGYTAVTTLSGTNLTIYYAETPTGIGSIGDEVSVACTNLTNTHTAYVSGAAIHVGHGVYRICLPAEAVDGAAGTVVTVTVTDETATARTEWVKVLLTPPVNSTLTSGTTPPALNVADGIIEANIKEIDDDATADGNLKLMFNGTGYAGGTTKLQTLLADGAHGGNSATLVLGAGATINNADGVGLTVTGSSHGVSIGSTSSGHGLYVSGATNGNGIYATGAGSGSGLNAGFSSGMLQSIAGYVWDELSTGHTDAGKAGAQLWTELDKVPKSDSTVSWNSTALAAIASTIWAKTLTAPTAGNSPDTPTLEEALSWLYSRWFNKSITTGDEFQLFKRNETDKIYEQDFSDDGTNLTIGEAKAAD